MTIPQAVDLILWCSVETQGDEIYVLKMPAINIYELAEAMIEYCHEVYQTASHISIETIGIRPGEKLFEELISGEEGGKLDDKGEYFIIRRVENEKTPYLNFSYSSNRVDTLSKEEIKKMLYENNI